MFTIESAKELLCEAREARAVQLLKHARRVLAPVFLADPDESEGGRVVARHLDSALISLGHAVN